MGGCGINSAAASIKVPIWRSQSAPLISFQSLIFFAASMNCRRPSKTCGSIGYPLKIQVPAVPAVQPLRSVQVSTPDRCRGRLSFLSRVAGETFYEPCQGLFKNILCRRLTHLLQSDVGQV